MSKRMYDQDCPIAAFLDLFGGRWTLLIVRELLDRPMRYKDLLVSLPGIGTNLLADRLRHLRHYGVLTRLSDAEQGAKRYALTRQGRALEGVVRQMARWSEQHANQTPSGQT
jgi:DNA-binding HxlR family transcriptional regulator